MSHLFLSGCHILCIEIICLSSYVITAVYFPPVYALITLLSPTASIEAESCASFKVSSIYRNSSLLNILTADSNTSSSNEYLKKKAVHFILSSFALFLVSSSAVFCTDSRYIFLSSAFSHASFNSFSVS